MTTVSCLLLQLTHGQGSLYFCGSLERFYENFSDGLTVGALALSCVQNTGANMNYAAHPSKSPRTTASRLQDFLQPSYSVRASPTLMMM